MGYRQNSRDPNQISQNVVSDQETLEYMLHVRSLSSIILIRKYHNHRIIAIYLTANPYLYIFEMFSSYMNHFLLMRTNSDANGASVKMHKLACFLTFCMRQIPKTHMPGSNTIYGMH